MAEDKNLARIAALDTATLSDAMDRHGIPGQCLGIHPVDPKFRLAGRAWTLRYGPFDPLHPGTVGDYIDDVPDGGVVVLDNQGRVDMTVWGDILTLVAHRRGLGGTVIDGPCRDTDLAREIGYPLFSRSVSMRTGKDRVQVEATGETVTIGGARVNPGDLLRGDCDGVVAVPREVEDKILDTAEEIMAAEARIREALDRGMRLDEARKVNRYHALQTRAKG
ncbi:MAG TPA: RraA family protein [Hyphomicrobiales bacterium]|nr:RraA family protein [Hyphomicrobiales bacterium]